MKYLIVALLASSPCCCILGQLPIEPTRTIAFITNEGSYMNVDVSPDGKTLVFDLLGDLYTVPAIGGKAKQITHGMALNLRPVWSPDGKRIAYLSDISGSLHLNLRDTSGTFHRVFGVNTEQLALDRLTSPLWTTDNQYVYMEDIRYGGINRSKTYSVIGGTLVMDSVFNRPISFSHDGQQGYYVSGDSIYQITFNTGARRCWTALPSANAGMKLSTDGKWLAYIYESDTGKSLIVRNVLTREEKMLVRQMSKPPYNYKASISPPHFSFSPDAQYIYISYFGQIHRIEVATAEDVIIPFKAEVNVETGALNYHRFRVTHDSLNIKYVRSANLRADGKQLIFAALNTIYVMDIPGATSRPLVKQPLNQFEPVYSPDGKWIAYVTWSDAVGGQVWKVSANGGSPKRLSREPGLYAGVTWSKDSKKIALVMGKPQLGSRDVMGTGKIIILDVNGHMLKTIDETVDLNNDLRFSARGDKLFYQPALELKRLLVSRDLANDSVTTVLKGEGNQFLERVMMRDIQVSPNQKFVVFSANEDLYLLPFTRVGGVQLISDFGKTLPAIRFANGVDPYWSADGKKVYWTYANRFNAVDAEKIIYAAEQYRVGNRNGANSLSVNIEPDEQVQMNLRAAVAYGRGTIAFTHARIITMKGEEVIENGSIIITDGRIVEVGDARDIPIPKNAHVMNCKGKTIMPGLIDLHLHMKLPSGVTAQQNWMYLASLAYGVTTASDPSQDYGAFGYTELLATGKMTGPRLFGAGRAVRPDFLIRMNDLNDARLLVQKRESMGGILVKQYELATRMQRQWLSMACREAGINMTNEGGINPLLHIAMIKDGNTGIEHNAALGEVYEDVIQLRARCGTYWDPTLQVDANPNPEFQAKHYMNWKYWRNDINEKMKRFIPSKELNEIMQASPTDSTQPGFLAPAKIDAAVRHAGGKLVMGSHGDNKGVGPHNELWALQAGGLTNMEALQAGTILGAEALGIQQDLGSLEAGKVTDLIILNKNPLDDIHNSREIRYVMKDGILYDGDTLDELWPIKKKLPEWRFKRKIKQ